MIRSCSYTNFFNFNIFSGLVYPITNRQTLMVPKTLPNPDNLQIVKVSNKVVDSKNCSKTLFLFYITFMYYHNTQAKQFIKPLKKNTAFLPCQMTWAWWYTFAWLLDLIFHNQKFCFWCMPTDEKKKPHIKKPLNAFMLYMKEMRAKVVAECTLKESAAINQILGRRVSCKVFSLSKKLQTKSWFPHSALLLTRRYNDDDVKLIKLNLQLSTKQHISYVMLHTAKTV